MSKLRSKGRGKGRASGPTGPPGLGDSRIAELERRHGQLKSDVETKVALDAAKRHEPGENNPESKTRAIVVGLETDIVARIEKIITQQIDWRQLKDTIDTQVRNAFRVQFGDIMNEIEKRVADTLTYGMTGGGPIATAMGTDGSGGSNRGGVNVEGDGGIMQKKMHDMSVRIDTIDSRISDFAGDLSTMNNSLNGSTGLRGQIHDVQREQYVLEHQKLAGFVEHIGKVEKMFHDLEEKIPGIVKTHFETENKRFEVQLIARIKQQFDGKIDALRQRLVDTEKRAKNIEGELKMQKKITSELKTTVEQNRDARMEFETKSSKLEHDLNGLRTQHRSLDTKMDRMKKKFEDLPEMNALADQVYNIEGRIKVLDNSMSQKLKEQSTRLHQSIKEEIHASNAKIMAVQKQLANSISSDMAHSMSSSFDTVGEWGQSSNVKHSGEKRRGTRATLAVPANFQAQLQTISTVDDSSMRLVENKIEDILGQLSDLRETIDEVREDSLTSGSSLQREDLAKSIAPFKVQLIALEQVADKTKEDVADLTHSLQGQNDAMGVLRAQMMDYISESCRSIKADLDLSALGAGGIDDAQLEAERAEAQQRVREVEESFAAKHRAVLDDLSKMKQAISWDKEAAAKRVNEVHEMANMQGKANQRTAAAVDTTITQVDMLLRKMAHVDLLKRSFDGHIQEFSYLKKDLNKFEIKLEDSVAASESLAAELRRQNEEARQSKAEQMIRTNRQRAGTESGYEIAGPLSKATMKGSRSVHHLPHVRTI